MLTEEERWQVNWGDPVQARRWLRHLAGYLKRDVEALGGQIRSIEWLLGQVGSAEPPLPAGKADVVEPELEPSKVCFHCSRHSGQPGVQILPPSIFPTPGFAICTDCAHLAARAAEMLEKEPEAQGAPKTPP
jgi:hypothetical protein